MVNRRGPQWQRFLKAWKTTPQLTQSEVGLQSPINASESCPETCISEPSWMGAYAFDATVLVAKAWAKTLRDGGDPRDLTSGDLLQAIRTVSYTNGVRGLGLGLSLPAATDPFLQVTGNVTLDSGRGNLSAANRYNVVQFQDR